MKRSSLALLALLIGFAATRAFAQESQLQSDLRREGQEIKDSCAGGPGSNIAKAIPGCVITIATDDPFHLAIGSLAPQNGMGFGLGFAEHYTPNERWRLGFNADAVAATGGSYRAGFYMKVIATPPSATGGGIVVRHPGDPVPAPRATVTVQEAPVINLYAQTISLKTLTVEAGQGLFSERQTIAGANVVYPFGRFAAVSVLHPSVVLAANTRFVTTESVDPSLARDDRFAQFEESVHIKPNVGDGFLRLNYSASLQQFAGLGDAHASFNRWTVDLNHEFPLYRSASSTGPRETNGPDECTQSLGSHGCAPVSYSRNREGAVSVRLLASASSPRSGSSVPFYFQPTLGGSDVNGQRLLAAFDDYRFRGPNLLALQESIEHSVWGPIGVYALAEQGRVTAEGQSLTFSDLAHSFGVGLTIRAGGFPLVNLTFAWGSEGHHIIGTIDPSLLGGGGRPSLY